MLKGIFVDKNEHYKQVFKGEEQYKELIQLNSTLNTNLNSKELVLKQKVDAL